MSDRRVITIGNFDGVHIGHQALLRRSRSLAGDGVVMAICFFPHPATVLQPGRVPPLLTEPARRIELLRESGADEVQIIESTRDLLALEPEQFLERYLVPLKPDAVVEGHDFRFGRARRGDERLLESFGAEHRFAVEIVEPIRVGLDDQSEVTASSSLVRWLVEQGRVRDAARILGRPFDIGGTVVRGDRRGREMGFPTANLATRTALPADAIYAGWAELPDGSVRPAAIHVGTRSTFGDDLRTVEAYVLDWGGPLEEGRDEYGWSIRLRLQTWLRDQIRFDSMEQLIEQIGRDVERTREATGEPSNVARVPVEESMA